LDNLLCWGFNLYGQLGDGSTIDRHTPTLIDHGIASSYIVKIAPGNEHTCAIDSLGNLLCWGRNQYGQIGDGTTLNKSTPVLVSSGTTESTSAVKLSSGSSHSCAIYGAGALKCWGWNNFSQVGDGSGVNILTPYDLILWADDTILVPAQIALGVYHTCAVASTGHLFCWGLNSEGQLGTGDNYTLYTPVLISTGIAQVSLGEGHTCTISVINILMCYGSNGFGQIGDGTYLDRYTPTQVNLDETGDIYATQIIAGHSHNCAVDNLDNLHCWGWNGYGQLGDGTISDKNNPEYILSLQFPTFPMSLGGYHTCTVNTDDNLLLCWGLNDHGQLGDGTTANKLEPEIISYGSEDPDNIFIQEIELGLSYTTCAIDNLRNLLCWGNNEFGQVGDGSNTDRYTPTLILGGSESFYVESVVVGQEHSCMTTNLDDFGCWGRNNHGQIGDGTNVDKNSPTLVDTGSVVQSYALGGSHTCAIVISGELKCWGLNAFGQIGDAEYTNKNSPINVVGVFRFGTRTATKISLGTFHTCAIDDEDNAWCWGWNQYGQLGDGSTINRSTPVPVVSHSNSNNQQSASQIELGGSHSCIIDAADEIYCWGRNNRGQLGDGTSTSTSNTPVPVDFSSTSGSSAVIIPASISLGDFHTCALDKLNVLYCWGRNGYGQLGDGSTTDTSSPIIINLFGSIGI